MKRVILLAPYFPPRRRVGSYRAFKFAIHLQSYGWEPLVVQLKVSNSQLSAREQEFLQNIRRIELGLPFDRSASSSGSYAPAKGQKDKGPASNYLGELFDLSFPVDTWWPVLKYHQKALQKLISDYKPHILWSTADPWSSNVLAMNLARISSLPWVADFRDPWTLCPVRSQGRMPWAKAIDKRMEKKIMTRADHVIFTAENTARKYREFYHDVNTPMSTIYNSFDEKYFLPLSPKKESDSDKKKFIILFYGRFRPLSSANLIIRLLKLIREKDAHVFKAITVQSSGKLTSTDSATATAAGVLDTFETIKAEPYENTRNRLNQSDLLFLSTEVDRDEIVPAKFWDYLTANKPILSLSQNPEIENILQETHTGKQYPVTDMDKAAELVIQCVKSWQAGQSIPFTNEGSTAKLQEYSSVQTTSQLAGIFDQLIDH